MTLHPILLNFLIYEDNFLLFFISVLLYGKYGVRSPKFIWAPCAQLYSSAETPQPPIRNFCVKDACHGTVGNLHEYCTVYWIQDRLALNIFIYLLCFTFYFLETNWSHDESMPQAEAVHCLPLRRWIRHAGKQCQKNIRTPKVIIIKFFLKLLYRTV